jgi:hypothetical protein
MWVDVCGSEKAHVRALRVREHEADEERSIVSAGE